MSRLMRSRWAAFGAAVAVTIGAGGVGLVRATTSSGERTVLNTITACRLVDTRSTDVDPRVTPFGAGETITLTARGTNGQCTIPTDAVALDLNLTALNATEVTFWTLWSGGPQPNASSINPAPGQPPATNAATVDLSPTGTFNVFNAFGSVDGIIDVTGYYTDHDHDDRYDTSAEVDAKIAANPGPKGDKGDKGDQGDQGPPGVDPAKIVWVAKSGGDFTTVSAALASITDASATNPYLIKIAPGIYTEGTTIDGKEHVAIEGSGRGTTVLDWCCVTSSNFERVFRATVPVTLRNLTIRNLQTVADGTVVTLLGGGTLEHVEVISENAQATSNAIVAAGGDLVLRDVIASATSSSVGASAVGLSASVTTAQLDGVILGASTPGTDRTMRILGGDWSLRNVQVTTGGGGADEGVTLFNTSKIEIVDSSISGDAPIFAAVGATPTLRVERSTILGATAGAKVINMDNGGTATVLHNDVNGVVSGASNTCMANTQSNTLKFFPDTCPN